MHAASGMAGNGGQRLAEVAPSRDVEPLEEAEDEDDPEDEPPSPAEPEDDPDEEEAPASLAGESAVSLHAMRSAHAAAK